MADVVKHAAAQGNAYEHLLDREEAVWERFGRNRTLLVRHGETVTEDPPALLERLRRGEPVEVDDHRLPRRFRPQAGGAGLCRVRVWPDGHVEVVG